MSAARALAVVPRAQDSSRPDVSWIKKNVPVLEVGRALGIRIRKDRRAQCWRPENHTHGDADPSLSFSERRNRVRCFVCDMRGGHSNVDLVMGVLRVRFATAVEWIAERFAVPNVKPGHPVGRSMAESSPYRVGVHGSDLEVLVRSGLFGQLSAAERSILVVLYHWRDPETGFAHLSYCALMRYSGIGSRTSVARAIKRLARLHAIQVHRGLRTGVTRGCSSYAVTLDDQKLYELCNQTFQAARGEIAQERDFRKSLRARRALSPRPVPVSTIPAKETPKASTCTGLNLSSLGGPLLNKSVHSVDRVIGVSGIRVAQQTAARS